MTRKEIGIGKRYVAKISGNLVPVQILRIDNLALGIYGTKTRYHCVNEKTQREITIKSAAKFRRELLIDGGITEI